MLLYIFLYFIALIILMFDIFLLCLTIEKAYCVFIKKQIINYPSSYWLRKAVVDVIKEYNIKNAVICDIGSGFGGLSRFMSKNLSKNAVVYGLENMWFSYFISRVLDFIEFSKAKTIKCDAFEYLKVCNKFNIAVAYQGPKINDKLLKFKNKFDILILFDVPLSNYEPTKIVEVGHGATIYLHKFKYEHKLFIYEFK